MSGKTKKNAIGFVMVTNPGIFVVDAWPVLEWYRRREPASQLFERFLTRAAVDNSTLLMSRMNYGEIRYKAREYFSSDAVETLLREIASLVELISVDDDLIVEAADLKFRYKCSYADGFAAALAVRNGAALVTGDPDFLKLQSAGVLRLVWLGA